MKILLNQLTTEELKVVLKNNSKISDEVYEICLESNFMKIQEWFDDLKKHLSNYSYGGCYSSHISISDNYNFIKTLVDLDTEHLLLDEQDSIKANNLLRASETFYIMSYFNKNFDRLESYIESSITDFQRIIGNLLDTLIEVDEENIEYYFIEYFSQDSEIYITDKETMIAYSDETICYS